MTETSAPPTIYLIWLAGASCDGCTMAMLGAARPGIEDVMLGTIPDVPQITVLHPALALESGDDYRAYLEKAAAGELGIFLLVLEGSILDELRAGAGSFSRLGTYEGRPRTTAAWLQLLAPQAAAMIAIGSCATWGGIPAAAGSLTGAVGLEEFLGPDFTSQGGLPVINVPGCAPSGTAFIATVVYVYYHLAQLVPLDLDEDNRPRWLYNETTRPVPPKTDYIIDITAYDKAGQPTVECPVPSLGWMGGIGGCGHVGGACIGCTDRDFTDKLLPLSRLYPEMMSE